MLKLLDFRTEYQVNPIGIDDKKPHFSWKYGKDFTNKQKSYRITVSLSKDKIDSPDVWDSGVVVDSRNINIEYNGAELKSHTIYYVKCYTEDTAGNSYESDICTFETALLHSEDWKGKWVSLPVAFNGGTLLFRKQWDLPTDKKVKYARAYVCGLGYHEFFVNGKKVGKSVLNPANVEYSKRVMYCVYPMDLLPGKNVIGVEIGYGWFGARKLLAEFYIEFDDGTVIEDHTQPCNGWWSGGSPTIDNGVYGGEIYDARIEDKYPLNWATNDYEPSWENGWMYTIWTPAPEGKLEVQKIEPIEVCATYPEISRENKGNGVYIIDVGQNMAGWLRIKVKGERGSSVTLKFGELLDDKGYVNQLNLRSARCSDTYILKGEGVEEWAPRFTYHGFRYVQAEISGNAELISAVGEHVHTATKVVGEFNCSDDRLNVLHKNALITEQNNEHSILTDCPQRDERFGWLNDLSARIYQTMYNIDMSRFSPKFIRDITHTQTEEGAIADTAPYYTGGVPADPVCVIYLLLAEYGYRYYGDKSMCINEYDGLKKWTDFLLSHSKGYIMDYAYYADWVVPYPDEKCDNLYVSTLYLLWHLKEMAKTATIVGNDADALYYEKHAKNAKQAIQEKYFNKETKNYNGGTQTENALAISLGVCPEEYAQAVADNIYKDVLKHNHHCSSGNIGYRHVFYVLSEYGYADEVINILTNPEYPGWGFMLKNGATTVWERWESEMSNEMDSFDHPMFGSYDAFLYRFMGGLGVEENAVACDKLIYAPVFTDKLSFANVKYDTVNGEVRCGWKRENGEIKVELQVPPCTEMTVGFDCVLNGKEVKKGSKLTCGNYALIVK